ncbi:hypothetical protein BDBG_16569 [Blastomyces gilchristii SLH14081]|uniref:Uncharacterized protein n=1 Tax=Blastomyces gilchristii (strain SLH14081) TaxID=559298 RepID=A0A179UEA2_BLAGS|nr:uncharacterized protein BDBG_16569 [Blastomyces gilchristii SLH14081]OAT06180.1 hypothetical protein BDBG_16569 [Blastomyces gilchristii SLH14081]
MAVKRTEKELNTDELISRRNDTLLRSMMTTAAAAREAGEEEEEDIIMKVVLSQLSDTVISIFNLAFLMVMKAATASQRHLLFTRKYQNKPLIVL